MPLSLSYWNIDGLFHRQGGQRTCKLDNHEISSILSHHDIFCLVETHMGPDDTVNFPDFHLYHNIRPRSKNAKKNYGGISIGIKLNIRDGIKILPPSNTEITWLKLSKSFFNFDQDRYLAIVYISPLSNTCTEKVDLFTSLENDIAAFSKQGKCYVVGDFNAKTSVEPDYCIDDDSPVTDIFPEYVCDLPLNRNNSDSHPVDHRGNQLLSLCQSTGMRILNGRVFGDTFGHCTCYSYAGRPSLIDYVLASSDIIDDIPYLYVHDPCDVSIHCMITCILETGVINYPVLESGDTLLCQDDVKRFLWSDGDEARYHNALNKVISNQSNAFNSCTCCHSSVECLSKILTDAAVASNIKQAYNKSPKSPLNKRKIGSNGRLKKKKLSSRNKDWFDSDCTNARKELQLAGKLAHSNPFNSNLIQNFQHKRKHYRKLVNRKRSAFRQSILNRLDKLEGQNPNAFWKLFNKLRNMDKLNKSCSQNPISCDQWVDHFNRLMNNVSSSCLEHEASLNEYIDSNKSLIFNELNFTITPSEILTCMKKLKKGKAPGPDGILNEMLKVGMGTPLLLPMLVRTFNYILTSGTFPVMWRCSYLTPVHKKGDFSTPSNYRGIAVGSNLCKLFCSILNNRLSNFCTENKIIPDCQIGFKKLARTADHVLTLKVLIDNYVKRVSKKYLFCAFVDFKSAFDTISRKSLVFKLLRSGIGGNFLSVLESMYNDVQYSVKLPSGVSNKFSSSIGVKQGCVLSPLLFNLFTSDLPDIFDSSCDPVSLHNVKLNCLMFADDLVIFSETHTGLQSALNNLADYCDKWHLTVNLNKTKIMIFNSTGRLLRRYHFTFHGNQIEVVDSYCYLGIIFSPSGNFNKACERLALQGRKALFKLKTWNLRGNIATALKLFQSLIAPILLYCCESWSPYYLKKPNESNFMLSCDSLPQEKVVLDFSKYLLGLNKKSTNAAVRGELGMFPLLIRALAQSIKYWMHLNSGASIAKLAFLQSLSLIQKKLGWAFHIKNMLQSFNLHDAWDNLGSKYPQLLLKNFKHRACERFINNWQFYLGLNDRGSGPQSSKLRTYKLFKSEFRLENYLLCTPNISMRNNYTKLRTSTHDLHIETGRYCRPEKPPDSRLCRFCNLNAVEDEKHFILHCPMYTNLRSDLFSTLASFTNFSSLTDNEKFKFIMSGANGDSEIIDLISKYITSSFSLRKSSTSF